MGDWVSKREAPRNTTLNWAYQFVETFQTMASAREYRRTSPAGRIQSSSAQDITIPLAGYEPIRVLAQENHGTTLRIAKDLPKPGKKPPILWIFEEGFVADLQWDPGEWHWQEAHNMGDAPFFGYSAKRGYRNAKQIQHIPSIATFIQRLNLRNSTVAQIIARLWHNARLRKVGALTWLTLNNGLPVGTWLQQMGILAPCKGCVQGCPEINHPTLLHGLPDRPACVEGLHEDLGGMGNASPPHHYLALCAPRRDRL